MALVFSGSYKVADAEDVKNTTYVDSIICYVYLLDLSCVAFKVERNCVGKTLLDLTFDYTELLEKDFFGLVFNIYEATGATGNKWLNPSKSVKKQLKNQSTPYSFWFRVKFYVPDPICLHEEYTRYQFCLQLRKDILEGRLPVAKATAAHLAGLVLQAELGDFSITDCKPGYVSQFNFIQQQTPEFETQASEWHRKCSSMMPSVAELEYLNVVRQIERYGIMIYQLNDPKKKSLSLGVSYSGITVLQTERSTDQFLWENIESIHYRRKRFLVNLKVPQLISDGEHIDTGRQSTFFRKSTEPHWNNRNGSVHYFSFMSTALAKEFWRYAVASHTFFRVQEPATATQAYGLGRAGRARGSVSIANRPISISATAAFSASFRVSSGFKRLLSLTRFRSTSTVNASASELSVGRTLSTVMELRRNSKGFDRMFSRTSSSHRSTSRSHIPSSSMVFSTPTLIEQHHHPASNTSLAGRQNETTPPVPNIPSTSNLNAYAQAPPGARDKLSAFPMPNRSSGRSPTQELIGSKGYSVSGNLPASNVRQAKNTTLDAEQLNEFVPNQGVRKTQNDTTPESRIRSTGSAGNQSFSLGSRVKSTILHGSQRKLAVTTPLLQKKSNDSAERERKGHVDQLTPESDNSDSSDETVVDQNAAIRYWKSRRSRSTVKNGNRLSGDTNRINSSDRYYGKHGEKLIASSAIFKTEGSATKRDSSLSTQANFSSVTVTKKSMLSDRIRNGSQQRGNDHVTASLRESPCWTNAERQKHADDQTEGFVGDPIHPGAPSGDLHNGVPSLVDTEASGLITIRIRPDSQGRYGFNVKGGVDYGTPVIVSRVGVNTPADLCIPRLSEGDQVVCINGTEVTGCRHSNVVNLIRLAKEVGNGLLELHVVPSDYVTDEPNDDVAILDSGDAPPLPPRSTIGAGARQISLLSNDRNSHRRRRCSFTSKRLSTGTNTSNSAQLVDSIEQLDSGLNDGSLLTAFEKLPRRKAGYTANASRLRENLNKNRYRDISPYDQTRVVLKNGTSDYINASLITMEFPKANLSLKYIAAQGPLPNTFGDFWQMCWEQYVSVVVMLTAISERGRVKCHQYWPLLGHTLRFPVATGRESSQASSYNIQLRTVKEDVTSEFAYREFQLSHTAAHSKHLGDSTNGPLRRSGDEARRVTQLQYISWPDHGVPKSTDDLIAFLQRVRAARGDKSAAPIVVHCSAGIGRTGVLIALETAMLLMEHGQAVNPLELVNTMRAQRALLVQTSGQFQFTCEAILRVFQNHTTR